MGRPGLGMWGATAGRAVLPLPPGEGGVRVQTAGSAVAMTSGGAVTPAQPPTQRRSEGRRRLRAPTADRPAPANSAAYTKGTSHHRGGCRAPASGFTNAQHMARDRAPPRLAVCEDGEWRDRGPRLLSPQRPRSFHCQASVSEHGPSGRHPRASGCHPRPGSRSGASSSGDPVAVRPVWGTLCALCSLSHRERAG